MASQPSEFEFILGYDWRTTSFMDIPRLNLGHPMGGPKECPTQSITMTWPQHRTRVILLSLNVLHDFVKSEPL